MDQAGSERGDATESRHPAREQVLGRWRSMGRMGVMGRMICGRLKSLVNCQELLAQVRFAGGKMFSKPLHGNRPMLKTAFGEDWHFKSRDRSHASGNNLPFQRIEPLLIVIRQRDEWDSLRHLD